MAIYETCGDENVYDADLALCLPPEVSSKIPEIDPQRLHTTYPFFYSIFPQAPASVCAVGKCATLPDNAIYPIENDPSGFCICIEGTAVFETCSAGTELSSQLLICLPIATRQLKCDASQCYKRKGLTTFAANDNSTSGYCSCQSNGTAAYVNCADEHVYDDDLQSCIVNACDPLQCRTRSQFEPFAARNTSKGFCSCDITPIFNHCASGHVFDVDMGVCVEQVIVLESDCDPLECNNRNSFEPFASKRNPKGFCSCDGENGSVRFQACSDGMSFDMNLGMCIDKHGIQKRSVEPTEKVRSLSFLKKFFQKLA